MKPVSSIDTPEELELEKRREDLRDRRWARHRDQLKLASVLVVLISAPRSVGELIQRLVL
jgi:hypothetical protein